MEEDSEESSDDVQREDKPIVLWERCIQQSIFVDLSEDESIHLSDLENSFALHLSQTESATSEASIHLSGSSELSALDITSDSSIVSSKSVNSAERKTESRARSDEAQKANARPNEPSIKQKVEDAAQNTSDEDQEDLPYDGDLRSPYFNHTASSEGNSEGGHTVHGSPDPICLPELLQEDSKTKPNKSSKSLKPSEVAPLCPDPADIAHLLLRHFSQEELLQSGRLIEAETLPEVSLLESVDDTTLSIAPPHNRSTVQIKSSQTMSKTESENENFQGTIEREFNDFTSAASVKNKSNSGNLNQIGDISEDVMRQEQAGEDNQVQRVPLVRTRSFGEMKYGQGQVHYPLPDFSKVAPKVRIPKAPSGPVRSIPQSPKTIDRAESSPGMLEVIGRVLEDSIQPSEEPYVFKNNDEPTPAALVHHLQVEYDKLLTRYAEAENRIDQIRLGSNPSSEHNDAEEVEFEGNPVKHLVTYLPAENIPEKEADMSRDNTIKQVAPVSSQLHEESPSDGERMTAELRDIISQFKQKVEDLRCCVSNMATNTAEQQMMLRSMMEAQDQLERTYISKRDEHRALEMQNYMGLCRNTGTFDPDRLVEGDIFRIGMHLEDLKEMIDTNTLEQISPPHSSSTPTSMTALVHAKPAPLPFNTPSPPSSLRQVSNASFASSSCKTDTQNRKDAGEKEKVEEVREVHGNQGLKEFNEILNVGHNICISRVSSSSCHRDSLDKLNFHEAKDEEGLEEERSSASSEGRGHSDILAYLSETRSSSRQSQRNANSSTLNSNTECDLGDCVSLAVEVSCSFHPPGDSFIHSDSDPPLSTSCVSQRIVSPETDSGFGSSYMNHSANRTFQQNSVSGSIPSQSDGLSGSDSDGSCSNLDTEIHSAKPSVQTRLCGAAAAVELWVESTTKGPPLRLQGSQQKNHVSEPVLSTTIAAMGSPPNSCSCNSEAILALQAEVTMLKKNLEEGLVQLPHLAQRMDYLTSKYREHQERRSKTRTRLTPTSSSLGKSSSRDGNNVTSTQLRIDDWISSDMDPSRSKGTDSGDGSCSEIMLEIRLSPERIRRCGGSVHSLAESAEKLQRTTQSHRGTQANFALRGDTSLADNPISKRQPARRSFYSQDQWSAFQKPLLQVSYGSTSSLPASYKVREHQLQSHQRKHSTQSDSALLPSNVYFQRTPSPVSLSPRAVSKPRRKGTKVILEEDVSKTLDQAIEVARSMKRTTDRMASRLSADLAQSQLHKKHYNV
ncbi:microtubule organization protein AKNA isoform X2 [Nothobranchius furzeri]|uniref:Transcript variant X2 n=1 Tax=Nothobranchius furzeri TaxID=105023 RepID=A0A9D3BVF5_NOTFU|nr:transcript variant X2 [Nothobranchius furzeri]